MRERQIRMSSPYPIARRRTAALRAAARPTTLRHRVGTGACRSSDMLRLGEPRSGARPKGRAPWPWLRRVVLLAMMLFLLSTTVPPLHAADVPSQISNLKSQIATPQSTAISPFPQKLGDLDGDGRATVLDLVRVINHLNETVPLPPDLQLVAD